TPGALSYSMAFSQDGSYLYSGGNATCLAGFGVDSGTGVLTALNGSPYTPIGAGEPFAYTTDAQGRIFLADYANANVYALTTSAGVPTVAAGPVTSGLDAGGPVHGVLHPQGFYMVADRVGNQVGVYQIS